MSLWDKIKSLQWFITAGMVVAAVLLALAATRAVKRRGNAVKLERRSIELQNGATSRELYKSKKLLEAADKNKNEALLADDVVAKQLEKLGEANKSLDAIATRFNSKRLRST